MEDDPVVDTPPNILETEKGRSRTCTPGITAVSPSADDNSPCQLQAVVSFIRQDLAAADLKWTLFVAACQNYKHDSCLRPFPPMFVTDGDKDVKALIQAVESVPAFQQLEGSAANLPKSAIKLLHWVLLELKEPSLSKVDKSQINKVLDLVPCELSAPRPSLVLRLKYDASSVSEQRWELAEQQHGSLFAFHGSRVENFHSILYHGLQQHLTKNALFGQGVYLSSELLVCLPYSRTGLVWNRSCLGTQCSIVAMCEIIDHPSVHCQDEKDEGNKSRARAEDSLSGEVPHKLYVVPNSDLVKVRYLLVYTANSPSVSHQRQCQRSGRFIMWLARHKMIVLLLSYASLLVWVGLYRNPKFKRWCYDILCFFGII